MYTRLIPYTGLAEVVPYEEILKGVLEEYERSPRGWRILVAKAQGPGHDVYVLRPEGTMAVLKMESLSIPDPVGIGVEAASVDGKLRGLAEGGSHPFGFRPVSPELLGRMLRAGSSHPRSASQLIGEIMRQEPMPIGSVGTPVVLEGPVVRLPSTLPRSLVSPRQKELDALLQHELERMVRKKYGDSYLK